MDPGPKQNMVDAIAVVTAWLEASKEDPGVVDALLLERWGDHETSMQLVFGLIGLSGEMLFRLAKATGKTDRILLQEIGLKYSE